MSDKALGHEGRIKLLAREDEGDGSTLLVFLLDGVDQGRIRIKGSAVGGELHFYVTTETSKGGPLNIEWHSEGDAYRIIASTKDGARLDERFEFADLLPATKILALAANVK